MEALGFGRNFIIEAYQVDKVQLNDAAFLQKLLKTLSQRWLNAQDTQAVYVLSTDDGSSMALNLPESQLILHSFASQAAFSLQVFSRRSFDMQNLWEDLKKELKTGRYESFMLNRATLLQSSSKAKTLKDQELLGLRHYSQQRINQQVTQTHV